jgi:hypothetical protein
LLFIIFTEKTIAGETNDIIQEYAQDSDTAYSIQDGRTFSDRAMRVDD